MHERHSESHVRWDCKRRGGILPDHRRQVLSGNRGRQIGTILRSAYAAHSVDAREGPSYNPVSLFGSVSERVEMRPDGL